MMACGRCETDLDKCTCEDLEKRLLSVPNFVFKACAECGKHYARCRCDDPTWVMVGKDLGLTTHLEDIH